MTLGEKILTLRKARGWSQEDLADRVSVTRQAVSRWESDSAKPDADKLVALCDLFGVSADYLLRDKETKTDSDGPRGSAEVVKLSENKKNRLPWILNWCAVGFGAMTIFLLKLLSSVDPKEVGGEAIQQWGGNRVINAPHYSGLTGYVKHYNLEWLVWLAALMLGFGILWLLVQRFKRQRE